MSKSSLILETVFNFPVAILHPPFKITCNFPQFLSLNFRIPSESFAQNFPVAIFFRKLTF